MNIHYHPFINHIQQNHNQSFPYLIVSPFEIDNVLLNPRKTYPMNAYDGDPIDSWLVGSLAGWLPG